MNSATVRNLLVRGMLAGLAAGVLALTAAYFLGEPYVDKAIGFEEGGHSGHSHEHEVELVSRGLQSTAGLATGVLVYGVAFGGIAALAYCFALGRVGRFGPRATALLLSGCALLAVYVVPFLKYPANPPGADDPGTIGRRTTLYFLMIALTVLVALGTVITGRRLAGRFGNWNAALAAGTAFIAVMAAAMAVLPAIGETPKDYPAVALWQFRLASVGIQALLWASFGVLYGVLAERVLNPGTPGPARKAPAGTAPAA